MTDKPIVLADLPDMTKPFVWLDHKWAIMSQHETSENAAGNTPKKPGQYALLEFHKTGAYHVATLTNP